MAVRVWSDEEDMSVEEASEVEMEYGLNEWQ